MDKFNILVINPGSTSTQVGIYENDYQILSKSWAHSTEQLKLYVEDQYEFRKQAVYDTLNEAGISIKNVDAIAARGGRLKPIPSGTYLMNEEMLQDSYNKVNGNHASRLAVIIGNELSRETGCPVYTVDPICVDEMSIEARYSGLPIIERKSLGHALNMKAVARKTALELGKTYEETRLIIVHLGGGTSISGHLYGKMIDIINDFEGCFTPERSGGLPNLQLVKLCFSGEYTEQQIVKMMEGEGGFYAYLGTKDLREVEVRIHNGDKQAREVMNAYLYQLTKIIGSIIAILNFKVDVISITGSIAKSERVINHLSEIFSSIAPVKIYPGSFELDALASGVFRVLNGDEKAKCYPGGDLL